ncbi:hypothetical protein BCR36DRAFT_585737 [Piromyces finnis]|uniref:Uncharacterized protein n=1 Tax=Piromyces finnis TaxID=1754191 RepID=A0A1Y1V203_9FUNG|nr:hypothetical protein BCR36DRAFT_585737 [Piromyces finnis]|eukprot:ORX45423.1 hypothetical protein BCR36DRAFT_585737 [Piromyces finnis]
MYSIQNSKPCELVSQINHNIINPIDNHPENITSKSIIPQFSIHCRSKSVTFVEDCLEQIRLFNISDPPNSINMTPTHYSTGRINSHSLMKFNRHNRNEEIIPFTSEELKENALYDHPVRKHRPYSKFNMPYNLKMDFSFGDPISPKSLPSRNSPSSENTYNYKISDMKNNKITNATNIFIPKHKRSPVLSTNYTFSSNSLENSINFMNEKETLHHTSFIVKSQPIHPLNQLV